MISNKRTLVVLLSVASMFLAGCQTYTAQSTDFKTAWKTGQPQVAAQEVKKKVTDKKDKDGVVWGLELGTALRGAAMADIPPPPIDPKNPPAAPMGNAAGQAIPSAESLSTQFSKESLSAFESVENQIQAYDDQAKTRVGAESKALLVNLAELPYTGKGYDRIMLHVYKALNYLSLNNPEAARVEFNRSYQAQVDAKDANAKRIQEAQKLADDAAMKGEKDSSGQTATFDASKAQKDPKVNEAIAGVESEMNSMTFEAYANYVNPYAVFLDGLFFMTNASGGSDTEHARKSFERLSTMCNNPFVKDDLALAGDVAVGKSAENLTYVIFETGSAASLQEWKLSLPIPVDSNKIVVATAALPKLQVDNAFAPYLEVSAGGKSARTELLCNMDAVVAQEFKNEWPSILTKSLISTGLKAIMNYQVQKQAQKSGGTAGLLASITMNVFSMVSTIADTRSWTTLPKQFQYCRIPTSADRTVTVTVPGGLPKTVKLKEGKVNLVIVRNVAPGLPAYVDQAVLSL